MTEHSDPDDLARRYLDLWQDQMTALANDPAAADALARFWSAMGLGDGASGGGPQAGSGAAPGGTAPAALLAALQTAWGQTAWGQTAWGTPAHDASGGTAASGTAAAAGASGGGADDLDDIRRRLAALEERLAALESAEGGNGGSAEG